MNDFISDEMVGSSQKEIAPAADRTKVIVAAWAATLLLSKLPLVIARDVLGTDITWITPFWIGAAALLFGGSYVWPMLRPLRRYFLIMGVIIFLAFGVEPVVSRSAAWQDFFAGRPEPVANAGFRGLLIVGTLIVVAVLRLMGLSRQEAFLVAGDLKAAVGGNDRPAGKRRLSWAVLGPVMAGLLGLMFLAFMATQATGGLDAAAALPWLPLILLAAMLNAMAEEVVYRAAPLTTLLPAVGAGHALVLTALWFGLGHYYGGTPSGPIGLVQTGLLALLLGKAMLDTRGLGWSWIIHVVLDTVIYAMAVMML